MADNPTPIEFKDFDTIEDLFAMEPVLGDESQGWGFVEWFRQLMEEVVQAEPEEGLRREQRGAKFRSEMADFGVNVLDADTLLALHVLLVTIYGNLVLTFGNCTVGPHAIEHVDEIFKDLGVFFRDYSLSLGIKQPPASDAAAAEDA